MVSLQVVAQGAGVPHRALPIGVKTRTARTPRGGLSHHRGENLVTEWILAFDADCRFCEAVVDRVRGSKASRWVKANLDRLPSGYSEFASYPADYRRAIYGALSASARSDLWVAHFADYRKTHPGLSAEQSAVLDHATRSAPQIIA